MRKRWSVKKISCIAAVVSILAVSYAFNDDLFEISKQVEIFTTLYKELNLKYVDEVPPAKLVNSAIQAMLENLDPFTRFYDEQNLMQAEIDYDANLYGIGAEVTPLEGTLLVTALHKSYPADLAGLKIGDRITEVNGVELKSFDGNALELLRGEKASKLSIVYFRGNKKTATTLSRDDKTVKTVPFYGMLNQEVGYIVLTQFDKKASYNVRQALEALKQESAKSIILDLRDNPGGLLNEAVDIANLFIPKGQLVVSTKGKALAYNKVYRTTAMPVDSVMPLAILVNSQSASASEIVSGAVQDLDRGIILGKTTYGKGLVQNFVDLPYGTKMKITVSRYYTPSGRCIQSLDYSQKTLSGEAKKIDKKQYNTYKTKNGRPLHDQGGISPDIDTGTQAERKYIKHFVETLAIFDFATAYYYKHPDLKLETFALKDKDFEEFKLFVSNHETSSNTDIALGIKKSIDTTKMFLGKTLDAKLKDLLKAIKTNDIEMLEAYKPQIKTLIESEITRRYAYDDEYYQYKVNHDTEIKKALELLMDAKKYNEILRVK